MTPPDIAAIARGSARNMARHNSWPTDDEMVAELWKRVDRRGDDDCWPWMGKSRIKKDGRGILFFRGRRMLAPRLAFFAANGRWLSDAEFACHACDNAACCNPRHIWAGTHRDNCADFKRKGRGLKPTCKHGHRMEGDNVRFTRKGRRYCLACAKASNARWFRNRLTDAQRRALLAGLQPEGHGKWPICNTLADKGLVTLSPWALTPFGLSVRDHLLSGKQAS